MKYLHWLHLGFALLSLVTGCNTIAQRGPELERARAAVAVAYAEVTTGVTSWQGDLPLIGPGNQTDGYQPQNGEISGAIDNSDPVTGQVGTGIAWQPFTLATVKAARSAGKPVWIHVVHDGCGPCERLAQTVFRDPAFVSAVSERFVAVQVDRFKEAGPAVVSAYKAGNIDPVDLFVFPDGRYLRFIEAPASAGKFLGRLSGAEQFQTQARWPGYVSAASAGKWKLKGETVDASHLINHAKHRGKFNEAWLRSLSRNQLLTLHDHDHEPGDQVRWEFVPAGER